MKRVGRLLLMILWCCGGAAWAAGNVPASLPALPDPGTDPTGIASEDLDPAEAGLPFSCPQCGYASERLGDCPICHIPLIEEEIDSPDTANPSEDPDDQMDEEEDISIDDVGTVPEIQASRPVALPAPAPPGPPRRP